MPTRAANPALMASTMEDVSALPLKNCSNCDGDETEPLARVSFDDDAGVGASVAGWSVALSVGSSVLGSSVGARVARGHLVGLEVEEGDEVGRGVLVAFVVGAAVGLFVDDVVGAEVGVVVGFFVDDVVGAEVGVLVGFFVVDVVGAEVGVVVGFFVEVVVGAAVGAFVEPVSGGEVGLEPPVIGISRTKTSPASTVTVTAPLLIEGELEPDALQTLTELKVKSFGVMVTLARLLESITSAFAGSFVTPLLLIKVTTQEFESLFNWYSISPWTVRGMICW